jgi:hypothetical protein
MTETEVAKHLHSELKRVKIKTKEQLGYNNSYSVSSAAVVFGV